MRGHLSRLALVLALSSLAFYASRADTELPQLVTDTYSLLKKPIEALLPDLDEQPQQQTRLTDVAGVDLEAYQDLRGQRERWNEMRTLIESGRPIYTPLPSEVAISTIP